MVHRPLDPHLRRRLLDLAASADLAGMPGLADWAARLARGEWDPAWDPSPEALAALCEFFWPRPEDEERAPEW